ncbi:MAG: hypothetical protein SFV22_00795 [Saprospiraceae bacterium]|nr:hypothetical protein [Saprospiraceae bacterium]
MKGISTGSGQRTKRPGAVWALFFLCIWLSEARAQAQLRADSNHVETGNPLRLVLEIPLSAGRPDSLDFSPWQAVLPQKNIIAHSDWQRDDPVYRMELRVLFFEEDTLQLAPLALPLASGDTLFFPALDLVVSATPSPDDLNDMADIKDIHHEPVFWTDYLPWILGGLGIIALILLVAWWAKRRRMIRVQSRNIELPAHERALKKLEALAQKDWPRQGKVKEHYAELTFILREYLEKRFNIPALESTTAETLLYLQKEHLPESLPEALRDVLEQADLAKFARITPPESFHREALDIARNIISATTPAPPDPAP